MIEISYNAISEMCFDLSQKVSNLGWKFSSVYGIPRGGRIPALLIADRFEMPLVDKPHINTLIVDDIYDTGKTMDKYKDFNYKVVLISKKKDAITCSRELITPEWVQFPCEKDNNNESVEDNIVRLLTFIGENPEREGLLDTPKRVIKSYQDLYSGYGQNHREILQTQFTSDYNQMVISKGIEFFSTCEHHMLPFFGRVDIAYIPKGKVVGLSKLSRLVDMYARRLQIQEQMTEQIAQALDEVLMPQGVAVTITAKHFCMVSRGIKKQNSEMVTTKLTGAFFTEITTREEYYRLIK